nr:probable cytochrome P450 4d20 [Onthophagus taurus]
MWKTLRIPDGSVRDMMPNHPIQMLPHKKKSHDVKSEDRSVHLDDSEVQKAFEEVHSILGEDIHQTITNQQIMQMKYLDLVIKESMRLNTTAPVFLRTLEEDVPYEKTTLPKGLMVFMIPFMMHVDLELYPDPEKFIPERFLPENLSPNRYSYAPFNLGVRNCIGKLYAMVSMKIALAKMLLNYEFVDVHHQLCLSVEVTLQSKTGIRVGIRKRNYVEKNE